MNAVARIGVALLIGWMGLGMETNAEEKRMGEFKISSPEFAEGAAIPKAHAYKHGNVSPPLVISGIPERTKSLALIVDDPDAPAKTWVHWLLGNIPAHTPSIAAGHVPPGAVVGKNDFGEAQWGGPMPPSGTHRYFFRLTALDTELRLKPGYTRSQLESAMKGHVLQATQLMGRFSAER